MTLKELLNLPNKDLTDDELEVKISVLRKMRIAAEDTKPEDNDLELGEAGEVRSFKKHKPSTPKSNKDKQISSLLDGLTPEEEKFFMQRLAERRKQNA